MVNEDGKQIKQFDKKQWRHKKYSKEYKLKQWEERRRKTAFRKHQKELRREGIGAVKPDTFSQLLLNDGSETKTRKKKKKLSAFQAAQSEYQQKLEERRQKKEVTIKRKEEQEEALKQYRIRKAERFKKLSKKTRKGQPVMKDRIELLLEKIQTNSDVYKPC